MATTNTWEEVVSKISGVANNGAFSKTFTPTTSSQSASSAAGYYSSVSTTCNAVSLTGNAGTGQVLSGYTFYNNSLTRQTGTMTNRGALNWTPTGSTTYSVPAGYYSGGTLNSGTCYINGYNSGVSSGKVASWSSKTTTATISASGSNLSITRYNGGRSDSAVSGSGPWISFNTGVSKVLAIRVFLSVSPYATWTWHCGYPSRVMFVEGNSSVARGWEMGPIGTSSSSTFWVNGTNAKLPITTYDQTAHYRKSVSITIWYF